MKRIAKKETSKKVFAKFYEQGDIKNIVYLMREIPVDGVIDFYKVDKEKNVEDPSDYIATLKPIEQLNSFFRKEMIKYLA
jgi:hypothetical protein